MFKQLQLGTKLLAAFLVILLLTGMVAYVGYRGMGSVYDRADKTDDVNTMYKDLVEARQQEKNFIIRRDDEYIKKVEENVAEIKKQALETKEKFKKQNNKDQMDTVIKEIDDYEKAFKSYVVVAKEKDQLQAQNQSGEKLADVNRRLTEADKTMVKAAREAQKQCEDAKKDQQKKMEEEIIAADRTLLGTSLAAIVVGLFLAVFIARSITNPVAKTLTMLSELSKGHLDTRLRMEGADEIAQMAKAMDDFADNLQNNFVVALEKIADGNFAFDAHQMDAKDAIGAALKKTLEDMNATLSQIYLAGEQVNSAAAQVSSASQSLSQGATESAASLEEITSSMTEMGSQTKLNAGNATQANQLAGQARDAAQNGNLQMKEMVGAMGDISESAQNISKIIKVIDEIAFQTNLLALNAAVEAARAGRHGKGFAVVAEEVRNLAARSAKAAGETAELIEGSVRKTEKGTQIADRTAEALGEIVISVGKVTDLVGEIAAASNEQAQGISQVNEGLGQIDQVTQQNTASAEECAAAAEELSAQAGQLRQMLARFKLKMASGNQQQFAPMQPQQMAANRPQLDYGGWGGGGGVKVKPSSVIALDDKEFGKY
ncbi:MAG: methyl-accepting chemotaxis protein [Deltaproteobacteria bacterium]|nr:methyl-accepting chemotaxis protein [Deltaproteobacteria bacterium]